MPFSLYFHFNLSLLWKESLQFLPWLAEKELLHLPTNLHLTYCKCWLLLYFRSILWHLYWDSYPTLLLFSLFHVSLNPLGFFVCLIQGNGRPTQCKRPAPQTKAIFHNIVVPLIYHPFFSISIDTKLAFLVSWYTRLKISNKKEKDLSKLHPVVMFL